MTGNPVEKTSNVFQRPTAEILASWQKTIKSKVPLNFALVFVLGDDASALVGSLTSQSNWKHTRRHFEKITNSQGTTLVNIRNYTCSWKVCSFDNSNLTYQEQQLDVCLWNFHSEDVMEGCFPLFVAQGSVVIITHHYGTSKIERTAEWVRAIKVSFPPGHSWRF